MNARDRANNTPLIMACDLGHEQIVDFLLTYDKPRVLANPKDNFGETALMKATRHGNARIVEVSPTPHSSALYDSHATTTIA